jgi:aminobenzoyl-glutamate utilization protein B
MTETQVSCRFEKACSSYLPNRTLEAAMYQAVCHYGTPPGATRSALCRGDPRHPQRQRY